MNKVPCKGCEERQHNCHGSCDRYAEYRSKLNTQQKTESELFMAQNKRNTIEKMRRRK